MELVWETGKTQAACPTPTSRCEEAAMLASTVMLTRCSSCMCMQDEGLSQGFLNCHKMIQGLRNIVYVSC